MDTWLRVLIGRFYAARFMKRGFARRTYRAISDRFGDTHGTGWAATWFAILVESGSTHAWFTLLVANLMASAAHERRRNS